MTFDITSFTTTLDEVADAPPNILEDSILPPPNLADLTTGLDYDDSRLSRFTFPSNPQFRWKEYQVSNCKLVVGKGISGLIIMPDGRLIVEQFPNQVPASINHLANKIYREALAAGQLPPREPLEDVLISFVSEWFNHYHLAAITLPLLRKLYDLRGEVSQAVLPCPEIDLPDRQGADEYLETLQHIFGLDPARTRLLKPGIYPVKCARFLASGRGPIELVSSNAFRSIFDDVGSSGKTQGERDLFLARGNVRNVRAEDQDERAVFDRLKVKYPKLEWIVADYMTMSEQISMVHSARSLSALHGAALTNMIFAEHGTLEINERGTTDPTGFSIRPHFYHLSASRGFRYTLID